MLALLVVYGIFNYASLCRAILFASTIALKRYSGITILTSPFLFQFFYGMHMHFPSFFSQKSKYYKVIDYLI